MKTDNELIAEFMGFPVEYESLKFTGGTETKKRTMRYDTSWDWLMPVVEKINMMEPSEFNYHVDRMTHFRIEQSKIQMLSITSPIRIVYSAVVEFIKWYNTNQGVKPQ